MKYNINQVSTKADAPRGPVVRSAPGRGTVGKIDTNARTVATTKNFSLRGGSRKV